MLHAVQSLTHDKKPLCISVLLPLDRGVHFFLNEWSHI